MCQCVDAGLGLFSYLTLDKVRQLCKECILCIIFDQLWDCGSNAAIQSASWLGDEESLRHFLKLKVKIKHLKLDNLI